MEIFTHYETLKVTRDAPPDVIQAAYRALALKYHPDKHADAAESVSIMKNINVSYKILTDPYKKAEYDLWVRTQERNIRDPAKENLSPEAQAALDKVSKETAQAEGWAAQTARDAKDARDRANKAAKDAAAAGARDKAKWTAWAEKAAAEAAEAEKKAADAAAHAAATMSKAGLAKFQAGLKSGQAFTHYEALKVTRDAPAEVIRASYKVLAQNYQTTESQSDPEAARIIQIINESYKTLSHPQKRAEYDALIGKKKEQASAAPAKKDAAPSAPAARELTPRERDAKAAAEKAAAAAATTAAWVQQTEKEAQEAQAKADKAAQEAREKAKDKDAAKWTAWAAKLASEANDAKRRVAKAAAAAQEAKDKARRAAAEAARITAETESHAAEQDKQRSVWAAAEKTLEK